MKTSFSRLRKLLATTSGSILAVTVFATAIDRALLNAADGEAVTFAEHVAHILQEHCQECHRDGGIAPFALVTYDEAYAFRHQIADATKTRRMPPWKPVSGYGEFLHERRLAAADIELISRWVAANAPLGDKTKMPAPKRFDSSWVLGEPDLVIQPAESFTVSSGGADVYRCFVMPTHFSEDRYVSATEVIPGNAKIVHHLLTYVDSEGRSEELDKADPGPGYRCFGGPGFKSSSSFAGLGGWVPGARPTEMPEGVGMVLPAGARVVMQVHYHNHSGKPQTDLTKIGLHFAKRPIEKRSYVVPILNTLFEIPPGAKRYEVRTSWTVPARLDLHAIGINPHMHLLGREIKANATYPDGTTRPLVYVDDWDFNWQGHYLYAKPVPLPHGTVINVEAVYDNSAANPRQPNRPPKAVRWGENTTDEMCAVFLRFTVDQEHLSSRLKK